MKIDGRPSLLAMQELLQSAGGQDSTSPNGALSPASITQGAATVTGEDAVKAKRLSPAHTSGSSGVMSRNFYDKDFETSKYVEFRLDRFKQEKDMANNMSALMSSLMAQASVMSFNNVYDQRGAVTSEYVIARRLESKARQATEKEEREEVTENAENTHLAESREFLAEKSAEAMAPKNENGQPIPPVIKEVSGEPELTTPEPMATVPGTAQKGQSASAPDVVIPSTNTSVTVAGTPQVVEPLGPPLNLII